jgi:cation transport ATPase
MKTTSKTINSGGKGMDDKHDHEHHSHHQDHDADHDHEHHDHDHETGTAEYVRLGLMGIIVVASLTGWWRPFMARDWIAFAGTVLGGVPIYKEAWENLLKRRMTMELSMTIALLSARKPCSLRIVPLKLLRQYAKRTHYSKKLENAIGAPNTTDSAVCF